MRKKSMETFSETKAPFDDELLKAKRTRGNESVTTACLVKKEKVMLNFVARN